MRNAIKSDKLSKSTRRGQISNGPSYPREPPPPTRETRAVTPSSTPSLARSEAEGRVINHPDEGTQTKRTLEMKARLQPQARRRKMFLINSVEQMRLQPK
jgi:hypothetical protein